MVAGEECNLKSVWLEEPPGSPGQQLDVIGPPASIAPSMIYKLYRGAAGEIDGQKCRVWAEFPALQLCWAGFDLPAASHLRASLLDLSSCCCEVVILEDSELFRMEIHGRSFRVPSRRKGSQGVEPCANGAEASPGMMKHGLVVSMLGSSTTVVEFAEALEQLLASRDSEGRRGLEFIQKRLFQYLWKHQGNSRSEEALYEAQAVLAFNLEPKQGVAYLRSALGKTTDDEVGQWLAQMSTQKGGLDPTMLGNYFSRRDTLEVFKAFVRCLDFGGVDIVTALRRLFDTFKPGGEGQVITRILELFAEAYFLQWKCSASLPETAYADADSVLKLAVSLIMLNTGLHVATKKVPRSGKRPPGGGAAMTVEEYIANTRLVLGPNEVPEETLRCWYAVVKEAEISVEPLPRAAFSKLPVQPDIEGWLLVILGAQSHRRCWAVLALQRLYLFSDTNDVEPCDAIDLKDMRVQAVAHDSASRDRFNADLQGTRCLCLCLVRNSRSEVADAAGRAFEVSHPSHAPTILRRLSKPRVRLALVAESPDLMEKWVSLISSGPY